MPIQIKNNETTIGDTVCGNRTLVALASEILKKKDHKDLKEDSVLQIIERLQEELK
jgi:hypothetical protein